MSTTDRTCSVNNCDGKYEAKGLCNAHYLSERRKRLGPCTVDGCDVNQHSRGFCTWHYRKWREETTDEKCTVDVCDRGATMTGLCTAHYSRKWYLENGPERDHYYDMNDPVGIPQSYHGAHVKLRRERGPASDFQCIDCGEAAEHWSYNHEDDDEQVCRTDGLPYSLNVDSYDPRCVPCHNSFDNDGWSTCRRGHPLTDVPSETTVIKKSGGRQCRICLNRSKRKYDDPTEGHARKCDHDESEAYRRKSGSRKGDIVYCRACRRERSVA